MDKGEPVGILGPCPTSLVHLRSPMTTTRFTQLSDAPIREAWPDEARDFTPWLFDNIDFLSDALGIELKAIATEYAVDNFSVDITAEDSRTGDRVIIENQLEVSDHRHLGQVLTYLAGIKAKSIVWIARDFQEAHRSAVRWLNEHTDDDFAFFAVRLRVVRIEDSPFAPVFDVIEQPNNWDITLRDRTATAESELTRLRRQFWNRYLERHPGVFAPTRDSNVWVPMLSDGEVVLSMYVGSKTSGMFLRGRMGADSEHLAPFMSKHADVLEQALGPNQSTSRGYYYTTWQEIAVQQGTRWDELIDWMEAQRQRYAEVFRTIEESEMDATV